MTLADIGDALAGVLPQSYHYGAPPGTHAPYIVWAEDSQADAVWANNKMDIQTITGTIDLFTAKEYDPLFGKVQIALNELGISWRLNSIQHEDDTGLIHCEWVWEAETLWPK